jgi:hypothetical protein
VQSKAAIFSNVTSLPTGAGGARLTGVVSGNTLVLVVGSTRGGAPPQVPWATPTDSTGQTWSIAIAPNSTGNSSSDAVAVGIWYLLNANAGTHTLTQSFAGNPTWGTYAFLELPTCSGVDTTSSNHGETSVTSGDTGSASTTSATSILTAVLVTNTTGGGLASTGFSSPPASPAGMTALVVSNDTINTAGGEQAWIGLSATGSQIVTWNWTNTAGAAETAWAACFAAFKP